MTNNDELFKLKLAALLHDPISKALHLKDYEEGLRKDMEEIIGEHVSLDDRADEIASAMSKLLVDVLLDDVDLSSDITFKDVFHRSELKLNLKTLGEELKEKWSALKDELRELSSLEEKFFYLWRFLPDAIPEVNYVPADTRAPNHSIYDHLVQTSAVATALEKSEAPALFIFTISPVQSFIAQARRTADLWAGSYILSWLIWRSMKPVIEELGPDHVIYPNLRGQPLMDAWLKGKFSWGKLNVRAEAISIANFPNRFLAIIPAGRSYPEKVEESFKEALEELGERVYKWLEENLNEKPSKERVVNSLKRYFASYWVYVPFGKGELTGSKSLESILKDYAEFVSKDKEAYKLVQEIKELLKDKEELLNVGLGYSLLVELTEKLLGARKNVREFEEEVIKDGKYACSICGEREAVVGWLRSGVDKEKLVSWDIESNGAKHLLKEGEKLCPVCLTKRVFPRIFPELEDVKDAFKSEDEKDIIKHYPSTSEVAGVYEKLRVAYRIVKTGDGDWIKAFGEFLKKLKEEGLDNTYSLPKLRTLFELFKELNDDKRELVTNLEEVDAQLLHSSTFIESTFKNTYGIELSEVFEDKELIAKALNGISPSSYYAILMMDGDSMGKWIGGAMNLSLWDSLAREYVILALISNPTRAELIMRALRKSHPMSPSLHSEFSRRLSEFALGAVRNIVEGRYFGRLVYAGGDDVLALLPVEDVFNAAHDLQRAFKELVSRRATASAGIVIAHHKYPLSLALREARAAEKRAKDEFGRNAFAVSVVGGSGERLLTGGRWDVIQPLMSLVLAVQSEELSSRFLKEMSAIYRELARGDEVALGELLNVELRRVYGRKERSPEAIKELLFQLLEDYRKEYGVKGERYFISLLELASFLARVTNLEGEERG